jgi:antigen flippase
LSSYRQIFKSTAIIGGAQVASIAIGVVRNKALALMLGPVGIGLSGTYLTVAGMIGGVTGLGLGPSGVRQIAEASAANDPVRMARTVVALRRASLLAGIVGMLVGLALCLPLSHSTFGDAAHASDLALMALTLLLGCISAGQWALLQGLRRLGDLAKSQVWGAFWGMLGSVAIVYLLRDRGIAPYLVLSALITLVLSWWYARKIHVQQLRLSWAETFSEARGLMTLGVAFVLQNLLLGASGYLNRVLIIRELGLSAVGLYTATWTLSTYYVGIVLKAMGTDFYPRLTAVANDHPNMNRLVNEQIEMGLLVATPGVLAVLALAPWALHLFYSSDFAAGAGIIRWQVLGVFVQVFSWPASIVIIAKGRRGLFVLSEVINAVGGVGFLLLGIYLWKLDGIGIGFFLATLTSAAYSFWVGRRLIEFSMVRRCAEVLALSCVAVATAFLIPRLLPASWHMLCGIPLAVASGFVCLLVLQKLMGVNLLNLIRSRILAGR